jgi:hypothetical protein
MKTPKRRLNDGTGIYNLVGVAEGSGWVDFLTWLGEQTLKKFPVNSIYTDMDRANMPYNNPYNGSGYKNDAFGKSGVSYQILPRRQFYKRLLTICRNAPNGIGMGVRMAHAHDELVLPYHSFNDMFFPGENYTHKLDKNQWFYSDTLDPVAWRCELNGKASGINHVFLAEFGRGTRKRSDMNRPELAESLFAVALLNDLVVSGAYCSREATTKFWEIRDKAGITKPQVKTICYWEKGCPVKAEGKRAYATLYKTASGAAIGIGNYLDKSQTVKVTVDLAKLGLTGKKLTVTDLRSGKILKLSNDSFAVPVKSRNYTIVTITR